MKRFWRDVSIDGEGGVLLDGRPVRTPGRIPLVLPTRALAEAVAEEWRAVGDVLDARAMRLTGLANAAIDRIAPDPATFAQGIARYGESDLLCYRADAPAELVALQAAAWDPLLAWARERYDVHFAVTSGVVHVAQPAATLGRLTDAVCARDPFALAALQAIVTITGSLVLGLALAERAVDIEGAWRAAHVDEDWQADHWGDDPLAADARAARRADYDAAAVFLSRLGAISG